MTFPLFVLILVLLGVYIVSLTIGCGEKVYWEYLEQHSPAFRKMESGKYVYMFFVWLFTPFWGLWIILFKLMTAIVDFCGAVFDFGNAFRRKPRADLDWETLKREIEEMTK